ncbi:MAG: MFS transporter [Acidimicrobiia bacterium]|nr:MFS transporter [Acidimicrobiia bacterium]
MDDRRYRSRLLLVVMLSVMGFGSLMTIVTVSLSVIAEDLGTSRATLGWVVTGLMLAMAVATPLAGKLGDLKGHRVVFLWGLLGGIVTTALCGVAWDAASLITFRVLFGLSGALVMPNAMSLMMHAFGPERRASAMGWFQFAMTGAPTIGLVIGGPMIDVVGWRAIFYAFAVVSLGAFVAGWALLRDSPRRAGATLDYLGAVTLGTSVLLLLLAATRAAETVRTEGVGGVVADPATLALAAGALVAAIAFVRVERRATEPMLKLGYFRRRNFTAPLVSSALTQFAYMGGFVVTPLLLDDVYGWAVGGISLLLALRPGAFSVASPLGGRLAGQFGERLPLVGGAVLMVFSMLAFAASSAGSALVFVVAGLLLSGVASGIAGPASSSMVAGAVDPEDMGVANGMSQQLMFVGIVSGIQIMLVAVGDDATTGRYASTFVFGAVVAAGGLAAAMLSRGRDRAS